MRSWVQYFGKIVTGINNLILFLYLKKIEKIFLISKESRSHK
jgi:hypothetical protein